MLKKFALVAVGATAVLAAASPVASAAPVGSLPTVAQNGQDCSASSDGRGNVGLVDECNVIGQHNGFGNTFNGVPVGPSAGGGQSGLA